MNRRGFLRTLVGAAAASTTTYFLPPIGGWHSDVIVNPATTAYLAHDGGVESFGWPLMYPPPAAADLIAWNQRYVMFLMDLMRGTIPLPSNEAEVAELRRRYQV